MELDDIKNLRISSGDSILLLVLDGLGGLPRERGGPTALEAARTPNLDALAEAGDLGLHTPVAQGGQVDLEITARAQQHAHVAPGDSTLAQARQIGGQCTRLELHGL
ncbi:MAG: hypothetical protein ACE5FP_02225, partial [Gemmatimonadota bacterium]